MAPTLKQGSNNDKLNNKLKGYRMFKSQVVAISQALVNTTKPRFIHVTAIVIDKETQEKIVTPFHGKLVQSPKSQKNHPHLFTIQLCLKDSKGKSQYKTFDINKVLRVAFDHMVYTTDGLSLNPVAHKKRKLKIVETKKPNRVEKTGQPFKIGDKVEVLTSRDGIGDSVWDHCFQKGSIGEVTKVGTYTGEYKFGVLVKAEQKGRIGAISQYLAPIELKLAEEK